VTDNGVGIAAEAVAGVGMVSLRERAAELGGRCTVTSAEPNGTRVCARLPVAPHGQAPVLATGGGVGR
jgi:signal transduction histidine kinase